MPLFRKKDHFGTHLWTYDASAQVQVKEVIQTASKSKDWPLPNQELKHFRLETVPIETYFQNLLNLRKITRFELRFKLLWALKRYPEEIDKTFAIFIYEKDLLPVDKQLLLDYKILLY